MKNLLLIAFIFFGSLQLHAQDKIQWMSMNDALEAQKETPKKIFMDAYTDWCGPCKMIAPILEELNNEYEGKINIYKVDTEAEQELAAAFAIRSIPSMLFIPMNEQPQMSNGSLPKQELQKLIQEVLKVEI